jgi:hypothetical protein
MNFALGARELSKPVRVKLAGGQSHQYTIAVRADQYMRIVISGARFEALARLLGLRSLPVHLDHASLAEDDTTSTRD